MSNNPYLAKEFPPRFRDMTPEAADEAVTFALNLARENVAKIESVEIKDANFRNTILALDEASDLLDEVWNIANHLDSVSSTPELRAVLAKREPEVSDFESSICINDKLWQRVKACREKNEDLTPSQKILLKDTYKSFVQNGANLSDPDKQKLKRLDAKLAALTRKFSENALDAQNDWELHIKDEKELAGLTESAKNIARKNAQKKGLEGFLLTLDAPIFSPLLSFCENENLRKKMWLDYSNLCDGGKFDNNEIIREILRVRNEKALLLGNANFADYVLEDRMAKSGKSALNFVESLRGKVAPYFESDIREIESFAGKSPIDPWSGAYLSEKLRKQKYDFNSEDFRPYIVLERAMAGMFDLVKKLYGLEVKKSQAEAWDDSVMFFDVFDEGGQKLASFYADLFPRKGKRQGAWMNLLKEDEYGNPKLGIIAANFNEPSAATPSLLNHDELSTLFHEFGHLVHFILMNCPEKGLRYVAWDFVELPSQIMENWCNKKEVLDTFCAHYKSGEKLPDELFAKFEKAQKFRAATACMRQLSFAKIDLEMHANTPKFLSANIEELAQETLEGYKQRFSQRPHTILPHFTHIFGDPIGYAAGYYSYKWAEALDADAFSRFEKEGLFNRNTGRDFADKILKVGSSVEPEKAFENFMGRAPDFDALVRLRIIP